MVCVLLPFLFIVYIRVLHTAPRGPNSTNEAISPGRKTHFANKENIMYLRKMRWLGRMEHIPKKSHSARCQALELLYNSLCGLSQKIWRALVYMNFRRQGCHCWELQDELFAFCWRIGTAYVDPQPGLQLAFDRFYVACDQKQTKISSKKIEVLCLVQGCVSWGDA